eukprot:CAMPEP_0178731708 /NCGR_PEP_ID=MMETSP0699-20121125/30180_1 /TAXON_ID=265572 /ORGANISM="Extubocellulus spinifer, Strain CCMP396" /LENGTH=361 /DNA_ID=CAMNT_0020383785 /DNA_START=1379 /DNA_END=2464 /DNA_ORIENTATION=-
MGLHRPTISNARRQGLPVHVVPRASLQPTVIRFPLLLILLSLIEADAAAFIGWGFASSDEPAFLGRNRCSRSSILTSELPSSALGAAAGGSSSSKNTDASQPQEQQSRRRALLSGKLPITSRTVPLGITNPSVAEERDGKELSVTIWEVEKPNEMIELWWASGESDRETIGDPFGVVMWPGSILAAREMAARRDEIVNRTVLVLGAGTGLEAQAAAMLGAGRVYATDINSLSLRLLDYGIKEAGLDSVVESGVFDLCGTDPLPRADVVLAADILYNQDLGMQVGKRLMEILNMPQEQRPGVIITDSQRFYGTDFAPLLNEELERVGRSTIEWEERDLKVTTSGILVDEDQTYDVTARIISV